MLQTLNDSVVLPLARLCWLRQLLMISSGALFEQSLPAPLLLTQVSRIRDSDALGIQVHLLSSGELTAALHILGSRENSLENQNNALKDIHKS